MHEGGGRWGGRNKLVELKRRKEMKCIFIGGAKMKYVLKSVLQINLPINCPFTASKSFFTFEELSEGP